MCVYLLEGFASNKNSHKGESSYAEIICFNFWWKERPVFIPVFGAWLSVTEGRKCFTYHLSLRSPGRLSKVGMVYQPILEMGTPRPLGVMICPWSPASVQWS